MEKLSTNPLSGHPICSNEECHKPLVDKINRCSRCALAFYCNQDCQRKHWPKHKLVCEESKPEQIEWKGLKVVSFRAKYCTRALRIRFYMSLYNDMIEKIVLASARSKIATKVIQNPLGLFVVNPLQELPKLVARHRDDLTLLKEINFFGQQDPSPILESSAALLTEYVTLRKGSGRILAWSASTGQIAPNLFTFKIDNTEEDLHAWAINTGKDAFEFCYEKTGMVRLETVEYPPTIVAQLCGDSPKILPSAKLLSCFQYVLMKTETLFEGGLLLSLSNREQDVLVGDYRWWLNLGYANTREPQRGDIVLYISDKEGGEMEISHAAVYTGEGLVEQKPGIIYPHAYRCGVYDLTEIYGRYVIFLRKQV